MSLTFAWVLDLPIGSRTGGLSAVRWVNLVEHSVRGRKVSGAPLERAPHFDVIDYRIIPATSEFRISTSWCETATKDGVGSVRLANPIEPPA